MRLRLTPRDDWFYQTLTRAAENIGKGAQLLRELLDGSDPIATAKAIRDCEHDGDDLTHDLLRRLNSTFVTPIDREDLYALAGRLDDVLDLIEEAADLFVLYKIDELPEGCGLMADILCRAATRTAEAMAELRNPGDLHDYWVGINALENEADGLYRLLVSRLFSGAYEPLDVMKYRDVIERLEAAADAFEKVADTVETIAVKES